MRTSSAPKYIKGEKIEDFLGRVTRFLSDVEIALRFLSLSEARGDSFISDEVVIAAGAEALITNKLSGVLMEFMIPVSVSNVNSVLTKGPTTWTTKILSVKNQGTSSVTARILFFR